MDYRVPRGIVSLVAVHGYSEEDPIEVINEDLTELENSLKGFTKDSGLNFYRSRSGLPSIFLTNYDITREGVKLKPTNDFYRHLQVCLMGTSLAVIAAAWYLTKNEKHWKSEVYEISMAGLKKTLGDAKKDLFSWEKRDLTEIVTFSDG